MGQTPTYLLPYPELTDPADAQVAVKPLADRLEVVLPTITPPAPPVQSGPLANRPPAASVQNGATYYSTDTLGTWVAQSNTWQLVQQGEPVVTPAAFTAAPWTTPYEGMRARLVADDPIELVYSSGAWTSTTRLYDSGSGFFTSGTTGDLWQYVLQRTALGYSYLHGPAIPYRQGVAAGLTAQLRFIVVAANGSGSWGDIQPEAQGIAIGGTVVVGGGTALGATFQVNGATVKAYGDQAEGSWRTVNVPVTDLLIPDVKLWTNVSPNNTTTTVYGVTILSRWTK
jgi:hypothetical protein